MKGWIKMFTGSQVGCEGSISSPVLKNVFTVLVTVLKKQVNDCYHYADGVIYQDEEILALIRVYNDGYRIHYVGMSEQYFMVWNK